MQGVWAVKDIRSVDAQRTEARDSLALVNGTVASVESQARQQGAGGLPVSPPTRGVELHDLGKITPASRKCLGALDDQLAGRAARSSKGTGFSESVVTSPSRKRSGARSKVHRVPLTSIPHPVQVVASASSRCDIAPPFVVMHSRFPLLTTADTRRY